MAPRTDRIAVEMLWSSGDEMLHSFQSYEQNLWLSWATTNIFQEKCSNDTKKEAEKFYWYKTVSLTACASKIFPCIIYRRIDV